MASGLDLRITMQMEGLEGMEQLFKQFTVREQRKVLIPIFKKAARPTVQAMKASAPVSRRRMVIKGHQVKAKGGSFQLKVYAHGSGELKRSIGITTAKKAPTIFVGPRSTVKNDGWYYLPLSLGHRQMVPTGKKGESRQIGFTKGNPFLDNAWKRTQANVFATIKREVLAYLAQRSANGRSHTI